MKHIITIGLAWFFFALMSCEAQKSGVQMEKVNVEAPFEMPAIQVPDFSGADRFLITDFGAVQGGQGG